MTFTWTDAETALASALDGYESRAEQTRLAITIEKALREGKHLLAQAGTGTGKSFAGLIPAIAHATATGLPVVVSTATKALQSQYIRDLSFLQRVILQELGLRFEFAILKGRGNYVCHAKLAESPDVEGIDALREELESNPAHDGDFENLLARIDPRDKPKLTSSADECPGKKECIFGEICFAEAAKQRAHESQIVVANHALVGKDLQVREMSRNIDGESTASILPMDLGAVFFDEGHEVEQYMTNALGSEITSRSITSITHEAANFLDDPKLVEPVNAAATKLFFALEQFRDRQRNKTLDARALLKHEEEFFGLVEALRSLKEDVARVSVHGDDRKAQKRKRITKRVSGLTTRLVDLITVEDGQLVRWVEEDTSARGNGPKGAILKYAPLHVGAFLKRNLWDQIPAVLLSATLSTTPNDFSYITERLGLVKPEGFDAGTPFDYPKQARIFIPEGFDPNDTGKWRVQVQSHSLELIRAAGGRTLMLFTNREAMNMAHDALAEKIEDMGFRVLRQGDDTTPVLSKVFKEDETSVLFALKSFMTGFDVQGDSLRLVIIDKLPYENPKDVIWKARCELVDKTARNWNDKSFMAMTIPAMLLTLLQAVGRLIRSKSDEGLVAIFDSRVFAPKGYARVIQKALPPAKVVRTKQDAVAYLEELKSRRG